MCNCTPEDVHNYGPCDEFCDALQMVDWSYPVEDEFEDIAGNEQSQSPAEAASGGGFNPYNP